MKKIWDVIKEDWFVVVVVFVIFLAIERYKDGRNKEKKR